MSDLKKGDFVVMHTCAEAINHFGTVFRIATEPEDVYGSKCASIENDKCYFTAFALEFLAKVDLPENVKESEA